MKDVVQIKCVIIIIINDNMIILLLIIIIIYIFLSEFLKSLIYHD